MTNKTCWRKETRGIQAFGPLGNLKKQAQSFVGRSVVCCRYLTKGVERFPPLATALLTFLR